MYERGFEADWLCPDGEQMGRIDRDAIEERGLPSRLLMENAGRALTVALLRRFPDVRRPLIACGVGNNGGDGFVVARLMRERQSRCAPLVLCLGQPKRRSPEAQENLELLLNSDIEVVMGAEAKDLRSALERCDLIVDAVFGVGLRRAVEGPLAEALAVLAASRLPSLAVDLPSGLSSDTGEFLGPEWDPELIVTLGLPKQGLALRPWRAEIWVADIGLPAPSVESVEIHQRVTTAEGVAGRLPARPLDGHKGTFGHVLLVGGSEGKTGAATLAAQGALHVGAGLVTAAVPRSLNAIFEIKLTEAMTLPIEDEARGHLNEGDLPALLREASSREALIVGPGLGVAPGTVALLEGLLQQVRIPTLVDADGLNAFAGHPERLRGPGPRVLTPHPGEAARLLRKENAQVQADRVGAVRELAARTQAVVVLKGARTLIAEPGGELAINPTGGPGLASGGTGDVLAGVIGGLLAQGLEVFDAARVGAYLHGRAGDLGPAVGGLAGQVAARVPDAWLELQARDSRECLDESGVLRRFP